MRNSRTILSLLFAALATFLGFFLATPALADSVPDAEGGNPEGDVYSIGTDTTFAPFEFRDASGEIVGIDIDLMKAIEEDQGFQVEFHSMGINAALQALSSYQVDGVIAGAGITPEREETYDFSVSYFTSELSIAANEGSGIEGWQDLEGESVAVKTVSQSDDWDRDKQQDYDDEYHTLEQSRLSV